MFELWSQKLIPIDFVLHLCNKELATLFTGNVYFNNTLILWCQLLGFMAKQISKLHCPNIAELENIWFNRIRDLPIDSWQLRNLNHILD